MRGEEWGLCVAEAGPWGRSCPRSGSSSLERKRAARGPASARTLTLTLILISIRYGDCVHEDSQANGAPVGPLFQSGHPGIRLETEVYPAGTVHAQVAELAELVEWGKAPGIVQTVVGTAEQVLTAEQIN